MGFLITPQFQQKAARTAVDMVLMPLGLALEYRGVREWPIHLGVRFPYSLGLPGGLLSRSWIFVASSVPVLSLGVSKRW